MVSIPQDEIDRQFEVACERVPATVHLAPLYDPKNERVRS